MSECHRVDSPTETTMMYHQRMVYVTTDDAGGSPVTALCVPPPSDSRNLPELVGSLYEPKTFEEIRDASPPWCVSSNASISVPRVVSSVMPTADSVVSSSTNRTSKTSLQSVSLISVPQLVPGSPNPKPRTAAVTRSRGNNSKAENLAISGKDSGDGDPVTTQRRQKRLERNRESARLSRRRRKQYLEMLESRVVDFSHNMDKGRREHVAKALSIIQAKRRELMMENHSSYNDTESESMLTKKLHKMQTNLSRTSQELVVAATFRSQQLKSFALPPSTKFVLWLTLQPEEFYRGGRAASERLSAARIGERVLNRGTDKVTPAQSMWPLLCSEIGLSYEQEEKVRFFQQSILKNHETWLDRHTLFASEKALESIHDAMQAVTSEVNQREQSTLRILTPAQQIKFLAWAECNHDRLASATAASFATTPSGNLKYQTSNEQHAAVNLYVVNHRIQLVLEKIPRVAPLVKGAILKKLAQRPSFESLGCYDKEEEQMLMHDRSFSSANSLKRSASDMTIEVTSSEEKVHVLPISPCDAQMCATESVEKVIGPIKDILPPSPVASMMIKLIDIPAPIPTSNLTSSHLHHYQLMNDYPQPALLYPNTINPVPVRSESAPIFAAISGAATAAVTHHHRRKSSFLPSHLGLGPDEFWFDDGGTCAAAAEEFLLNLVDEDWAIGEGIDMETYH